MKIEIIYFDLSNMYVIKLRKIIKLNFLYKKLRIKLNFLILN